MLEKIGEIFLDSLIDSLKMLPLIFVTYIVIELMERRVAFEKRGKLLNGRAAPVFGALAGIFPQCGVSVMSAKFYEKGLIALGTLLSVFVATSDEAFSVLLASDKRLYLLPLLGLKFLIATLLGLIVNAFCKKSEQSDDEEELDHEDICAHCHDHVDAKDDEKSGKAFVERYLLVPLWHAAQTFLFIFIVSFVFGLLFGENGLLGITVVGGGWWEPLITAAIGLIPNCASSVVITTTFVQGGISFGALLAGLIPNAGVGLAVLFRNTKKIKRNIIILISLYALGAVCGLITQFITAAIF